MQMPSLEHIAEFEDDGYSVPSLDLNHLARAKIGGGPYRVVPGDVLEITIPAILEVMTADEPEVTDGDISYTCRVSNIGTVTLPVIGDIETAGKTLAEIELAVVDACYPTYTATRPLVSAKVNEYSKARVSITGAVENPGVYELRSDEMSLVALLMQAGGIIDEGAARIRIIHADQNKAIRVRQAYYKMPSETGQSFSKAEPAIENITQQREYERIVSVSRYPGSNEADGIESQVTFQRVSLSGTIGRLTIRRDQTILLSEQLDITNEIQRWAILDKLAVTRLHVSTDEAGRIWESLSKLAETIKPDSGMCSNENQLTCQITNSNPDFRVSYQKYDTTSERIIANQIPATYKELLQTTSLKNIPELITISEPEETVNSESIVLPVKGLNIPFSDVMLQDSDTVVAEPLEPEIFTVTGLVNKPGNFPYPANVRYNLMQALASAGGFDQVAEPRYATIYRQKSDGTIVDTTFQIVKDSKLTNALNTTIKPGDIIDVAHTAQTRHNVLLDRIFRFTFGAFIPLTR